MVLVAELETSRRIDLGHHDADQAVTWIDPEIGVVDTAPTKGTHRVVFDGSIGAGLDAEAVAEPEPVRWNPEPKRAGLIARHGVDGLGSEQSRPVELSPIQEHLKE